MAYVRPFAKRLKTHRIWESFTLEREMPGSRNEYGEFVPGATEIIALKGRSSPTGMDGGVFRDALTEGARLRDHRTFLLVDQDALPIRVGAGQTQADVLVYGGIRYRVLDAQPWTPVGLLPVLAIREEGQDA